jgi:hypothetical protein
LHRVNDRETRRRVERLERLAWWLDDRFRIPGTNITFGLDSLIGLVPGVGDSAAALGAAYFIVQAYQLGLPRGVLFRMAFNVLLDLAVGSIPLLGDIFDVGFKANRRNMALLKRHLDARRRWDEPG